MCACAAFAENFRLCGYQGERSGHWSHQSLHFTLRLKAEEKEKAISSRSILQLLGKVRTDRPDAS